MNEMPQPTRSERWGSVARIVLLLVAFLALPSRGRGEDNLPANAVASSRAPRDSGFYLGAGWSREFQTLKFDERAQLHSRNVQWDEWGQAISLSIGYNFGPRFRSEMALSGSWREARPEETRANTATARFTGYIPFWTRGAWRPHLIAGCNASGAVFHTPEMPDLLYTMLGGELGVGVLAGLNRHWALQFDYIHTVLDIEHELLDRKGESFDLKHVGRRGRAETLRVGMAYDF